MLTALFVAATGLLVAVYVAQQAYQGTKEAAGKQGVALAHLYQHVLTDPFRMEDEYRIYELISAPFSARHAIGNTATEDNLFNDYLEEIVLVDGNGTVLATSDPQHFPLASSFLKFAPGFSAFQQQLAGLKEDSPTLLLETEQDNFFVMAPVGENGLQYATLVLGYSFENLKSAAARQAAKLVMMIALITGLMMLAAWFVADRFTASLLRLTETMRQLATRHGFRIEKENPHAHDEVVQLHEIFKQFDQEVSNLLGTVQQQNLEQRAYLQTLDLLQDAVIEITTDGHLLRATDAWKAMTNMDKPTAVSIISCVHPEDSSGLLEQISALTYQQKEQVNIRFRMHRQNDADAYFWVEGRFAAVKLDDKIVSIRGVVRDITNTYRQERQISHMALHDSLTDLPNRTLLEDRMNMAISRAARSGLHVALGFIDLDHFKQVNDNFGHKIGDRMLKEVTSRLVHALRGADTLSRWGGDEFVVLCPDLKSLEDAKDISQKLSLLALEYITIDGTDFPFTFSAGFAVYPDDASDSEMLLAQADRAMFYAKAQGRNNIQFFNTIAGKESGRQSFYIQSRLMQAIHDNQIRCWLQPLISAKTGQVIGAEALARWYEPEHGWIPPSVFIPMAESMGLIDKLGQSVWQQALHALTLLPGDHHLSVNLSKRQLFSNTIVQQLLDDMAHANIDPCHIMLEITESIALSDVSFASERIAELDARGFGIAIDDFGVGYSSLSQLHEIPADELKLDKSFVKRIHEKSGLSMATAIISIAKSLDMKCVAEGVENAHTAELLVSMGVDALQGYHFARPMPIDDYLAWLETRLSPPEQAA